MIARPNVIVGVHLDGDVSRVYVNSHGRPNDRPYGRAAVKAFVQRTFERRD